MDEDSLGPARRARSADSAMNLSYLQGAGLQQDRPAFEQGSLARVPPGRYYTNQSSRSTAKMSVKLMEAARGRVISVAISRSGRQSSRASLVDPREYINAEGCMCYRVLLTDGRMPHVDFVFVPDYKLAAWVDCICLAYASWPCPRCHQVSYCSQHCQQKDWESHRVDCLTPRATLRPATWHGRLSQSQQNLAQDLLPPLYMMHSSSSVFEQIPEEPASPVAPPRKPHPFWKFWLKRRKKPSLL